NTPMNTHLLATAPPEQAGTAGAFMATTRTIGSSLGPVIAALAWGLGSAAPEGYRLSAWAVAAVLALGAAAMAAGRPWRAPASAAAGGPGRRRGDARSLTGRVWPVPSSRRRPASDRRCRGGSPPSAGSRRAARRSADWSARPRPGAPPAAPAG